MSSESEIVSEMRAEIKFSNNIKALKELWEKALGTKLIITKTEGSCYILRTKPTGWFNTLVLKNKKPETTYVIYLYSLLHLDLDPLVYSKMIDHILNPTKLTHKADRKQKILDNAIFNEPLFTLNILSTSANMVIYTVFTNSFSEHLHLFFDEKAGDETKVFDINTAEYLFKITDDSVYYSCIENLNLIRDKTNREPKRRAHEANDLLEHNQSTRITTPFFD